MAKPSPKNRRTTDLSDAEREELREIARRRLGLGTGGNGADGRTPDDGGDRGHAAPEPTQND
jgi:hypothetical protein